MPALAAAGTDLGDVLIDDLRRQLDALAGQLAGGLAALVPPADSAALATALVRVEGAARDPAGAAARRAHAARYSWHACADATVRAYRKARDWAVTREESTGDR